MLVLVISDIHGRTGNLQKIMELIHNKKPALILVLGDLTNFGGKKETEEALKPLEGFEVLAIPGNLDTPNVETALEEKGISLHGKKKKIANWTLAGFGGGRIGDPGEFLFSEEEIGKKLLELVDTEKNLVLLTHLPPFGTKLDLMHTAIHIGSTAVKKVIEEKQPLLHLCGHCHEAAGEEKIGKSTSINVGAVQDGKALLLELGDKPKWERIQV